MAKTKVRVVASMVQSDYAVLQVRTEARVLLAAAITKFLPSDYSTVTDFARFLGLSGS